jgi:hypothetical protein
MGGGQAGYSVKSKYLGNGVSQKKNLQLKNYLEEVNFCQKTKILVALLK